MLIFIFALIFIFIQFIVQTTGVTYPSIPPYRTASEYKKQFTFPQLIQILKDRGVECSGCRKKSEFSKLIADSAQYLPLLKNRPKDVVQEMKIAEDLAKQWNKENEDRAEYDHVMGLFKDKEDSKKNLISKEVITKLQNQGIDTKHLKHVNPWESFPGNQPKDNRPDQPSVEEQLEALDEDALLELQEEGIEFKPIEKDIAQRKKEEQKKKEQEEKRKKKEQEKLEQQKQADSKVEL